MAISQIMQMGPIKYDVGHSDLVSKNHQKVESSNLIKIK